MKFYTIENKNKSSKKIFLIYYLCMFVFCMVRITSAYVSFGEGQLNEFIYTLIIQLGVLFLLPLVLYNYLFKSKLKATFEEFHFSKINLRVVLISICIGILCFVINIAVNSFFNGLITFTGFRSYTSSGSNGDMSFWNFLVDVVMVAIIPAFAEEFLHRGLVLKGLRHIGFKKAILISSILFGLLHLNVQQFFYACVLGWIMGFVAVVAKNIWPAIIIHFMNNFISTYLTYADSNGWLFGDILDNVQNALVSNNGIWVFLGSFVIFIVVICLLCFFIWRLYIQSIVKKVDKALDEVYSSHMFEKNSPIFFEGQEVIRDFLENNTVLNLEVKKMDSPIDMVLPKEKSCYKLKRVDKVFLWGSVVLGGVITFFTYVWGLF